MAAFQSLKDIACELEEELTKVSNEFYCPKVGETVENGLAKKMQKLSMFTSKLRLLQAKRFAVSPEISQQQKNHSTTLHNYDDVATWSLIENQTAKCVSMTHALKVLMSTPQRKLTPELAERKEIIISLCKQYGLQEVELQKTVDNLNEKEKELLMVRKEWDKAVGDLRDRKAIGDGGHIVHTETTEYIKVKSLTQKIEVIRWLVNRLLTMNRSTKYDWLMDPHRRIEAVRTASEAVTIEMFAEK